MDAYKITLLVVSGVVVVGFAWQLRPSAAVRPRALGEAARQAGLAVTPEVEPILIARLRAQTRATLVGSMVALVAGTAGLLLLPTPDAYVAGPFLLIALTGMGTVVGNAIAEGRAALVPLDDRPRLARTPTPTRTDYLSAFDRRAAPVSLGVSALALVGLATLITANPDGAFGDAGLVELWLPGATLWFLALASAAVGRGLTTRILQRGQPAGDDVELAWSDALRSRTLIVFAQTPATGAFCSLALALLSVSSAASGSSATAQSISLWTILSVSVLTLAFSGIIVWSTVRMRTPHYLLRLWPAVAAQLCITAESEPIPAGHGRR
ncbi:hypothetical protein C3B59_04805 [Cryobacterium zongtaii]|uniref:Uncharacterized protein n=1 Tax=Cryobacterium zongtaii TaxID=1259217 RepID=A0A2S3ZNR3_9MICO|nr:hypothetical protein [Cryobacterium zongtaii]POH70396.1 hypothetical protein C3B59_04805 [Cryobacterium zongtaii]